ncbi:alanine racemase [Desulfonatronospira sp.]|uniref:alanine racemase n=1 Tax=Desulfonatronospira sp. TaxID=1962951 RepID=UPI0025C2BC85|nr:alanine racemase [Desulfonatronospira sp.]
MLRVEIDSGLIRDNYALLCSKTTSRIMAVVKADAYGHGLEEAARCLYSAGARRFGVGSVQEGARLRDCLDQPFIYSLLGPVTPEDYQLLYQREIIPFIHSWEQLKALKEVACRDSRVIPVTLKLETGMNRLGFRPADILHLLEFWEQCQGLKLHMLASHLSLADNVRGRQEVLRQLEIYEKCCQAMQARGHEFERSLANSAAILAHPETHLDCVRPGISLYGDNPFENTPWASKGQGLAQAMQVRAPVLAVHDLKKGGGVSYGLCFTAPRDMRIAIIGCGYADNYFRGLSNRGWMFFQGQRLPVLGRVCMQLSVVDATRVEDIAPGCGVYALGGYGSQAVSAREMAGWLNSISYEVFCSLGNNPRQWTRTG